MLIIEIAAGVYLAFVIRAIVRFFAFQVDRKSKIGRKLLKYFLY